MFKFEPVLIHVRIKVAPQSNSHMERCRSIHIVRIRLRTGWAFKNRLALIAINRI